ncbi:TonB family protein [Caulobacter sp. 17J80-11]|uniref:TonB family protein n=1 Tax=Caulobacter sp. 17J80-11 TaxID=2763502 RepID=UPI00165385E3|nr:TonB family protein [Caulobacter sp. 17J80-11]MBC6982719.1 TonB family protein [Caulobacter sp. 17J80-11]
MMMLRTADGGAVVHALDMGTRKPLPRWMWMAIAASAALHVAGGVWLYQRNFETPPLIQVPDEPPPFVISMAPPPPVEKPIERTPPKPPTPVHKPKAVAPATVPTLPLTPPDTPPAVYSTGPEIVAPSPATDVKSVEIKPAVAPPPVIANPKWISKPTSDQMARWYPLGAIEKEVSGRVVMKCRVTATGSVGNCAVTSEDPAGYGFGDAAIKLSRYFKMSPRTVDGQPVEGAEVSIPLRFGFQ